MSMKILLLNVSDDYDDMITDRSSSHLQGKADLFGSLGASEQIRAETLRVVCGSFYSFF